MFSKLKSLAGDSMTLEDMISKVDLKSMEGKSIETIRTLCGQLNKETVADVHKWMNSVTTIKNDPSLDSKSKETKLEQVPTTDTLLSFVKALIDAAIDSGGSSKKDLLKQGVGMAGKMSGVLTAGMDAAVLALLKKGMPKFIMSNKFEDFTQLIKNELPQKG